MCAVQVDRRIEDNFPKPDNIPIQGLNFWPYRPYNFKNCFFGTPQLLIYQVSNCTVIVQLWATLWWEKKGKLKVNRFFHKSVNFEHFWSIWFFIISAELEFFFNRAYTYSRKFVLLTWSRHYRISVHIFYQIVESIIISGIKKLKENFRVLFQNKDWR